MNKGSSRSRKSEDNGDARARELSRRQAEAEAKDAREAEVARARIAALEAWYDELAVQDRLEVDNRIQVQTLKAWGEREPSEAGARALRIAVLNECHRAEAASI